MNPLASAKRMAWGMLVLARALSALAVAAVLIFCVPRAPRGFALISWSFYEHQLFPPTLAALGTAGAVATLLRWGARYVLRDAFWGVAMPIAVVVAFTGNTRYALYFAGFVAAALTFLLVPRAVPNRWLTAEARLRTDAVLVGAAFGALFLCATWAPRASTRPLAAASPLDRWPSTPTFQRNEPVSLAADGIRVVVAAGGTLTSPLVVEARGNTLTIDPAFELTSYSESGFWTVFDYHTEYLPGWEVAAIDERTMALRAQGKLVSSRVLVRIVDGQLTVHSSSELRREVSVHLARAMVLGWSGGVPSEVRVDGHPFRVGGMPGRRASPLFDLLPPYPVEFVAYRRGRLELLRASQDEKGPFATLSILEDHDPTLSGRGFRVRIEGFARQCAREPSPTAGFGVSQAAFDAAYDRVNVELAATGIGRGFNTVRIAPGFYELTAVVSAEP